MAEYLLEQSFQRGEGSELNQVNNLRNIFCQLNKEDQLKEASLFSLMRVAIQLYQYKRDKSFYFQTQELIQRNRNFNIEEMRIEEVIANQFRQLDIYKKLIYQEFKFINYLLNLHVYIGDKYQTNVNDYILQRKNILAQTKYFDQTGQLLTKQLVITAFMLSNQIEIQEIQNKYLQNNEKHIDLLSNYLVQKEIILSKLIEQEDESDSKYKKLQEVLFKIMMVIKRYYGKDDLEYISIIKELISIDYEQPNDMDFEELCIFSIEALKQLHYQDDIKFFFYEKLILYRNSSNQDLSDIVELLNEDVQNDKNPNKMVESLLIYYQLVNMYGELGLQNLDQNQFQQFQQKFIKAFNLADLIDSIDFDKIKENLIEIATNHLKISQHNQKYLEMEDIVESLHNFVYTDNRFADISEQAQMIIKSEKNKRRLKGFLMTSIATICTVGASYMVYKKRFGLH